MSHANHAPTSSAASSPKSPILVSYRKTPLTARDEQKLATDIGILRAFTHVYCRKLHGAKKDNLCPDCAALLEYSIERRTRCPLDPKPKCKECPVHCYKPALRKKMQDVMRVAGMHFVFRGRVDWLVKYFLAS